LVKALKKAILIDSDDFLSYDFGPSHPLTPKRLVLTRTLIEEFGVLKDPEVSVEDAAKRYATDDEVGLVHGDLFIKLLKKASQKDYRGGAMWEIGLGPGDNPIFPNMYDSSRLYVGGSLLAADLVMTGETKHAFNISGGLHHAMGSRAVNANGETFNTGLSDRASGFCILNDCAITASYLFKKYDVKKIVYLDVDAHAGDGTTAIYYKSPDVLGISIHQHPRTLFPGTGYIDETGEGAGTGYTVNIPLVPGTYEKPYLRILNEIIAPLIKAYDPDIFITQLGVDTHWSDPLTNLALSISTYEKIARFIHDLTHDVCDGKWIALGGGGYSPDVVGKSWSLYFSVMAEKNLPNLVPAEWMKKVNELLGKETTPDLRDEFDEARLLGDERINVVDSQVEQIKEAIEMQDRPFYKK